VSSRRAGRTSEGTLLFMGAWVAGAIVSPWALGPPRPPADATRCLERLAGLALATIDTSTAVCPASGRPYADGACADHGVGARPGALAQELPPAPDLRSEREVETGAWLSRTTARVERGALVVSTRPRALVRALLAPLLALGALGIALVFTEEQYSGWRPGGPPPRPGKVGYAVRVALAALLNPLGLGALALLALETRVEVARDRVARGVGIGQDTVIDDPLALVALADGDVTYAVAVRRSGAVEPLLRLAPSSRGLVRAMIDAEAAPP
jgi:hypothetical protein